MAYKEYDYIFTDNAEADIDEVLSYIAEDLSNPDAAASFADALEDKFEEICKNPKTGRKVVNDYLKRDDIRRYLVKNHIVYYLIDEEKSEIVILRVVYGKRDQEKVVKGL